jgi:hypothetical protein
MQNNTLLSFVAMPNQWNVRNNSNADYINNIKNIIEIIKDNIYNIMK